MNSYCIYLKKRKNKPYCNLRKESIELAECRNCSNKEYKKSTYNRKSPAISEQQKSNNNQIRKYAQSLTKDKPKKAKMHNKSNNNQIRKNAQSLTKDKPKKAKMHNKSKKLTVTKDTYNYVIERDNYSCRLCCSTNWLQLHHILYRSQRKDLINDIDNCIMLCSDCHRLVHSNKKKWQPLLLEMIKDTNRLV